MQNPIKVLVFSLLFTVITLHIQALDQNNESKTQISATDPFEFLKIVLNPDGSLTRNNNPIVPPNTTSLAISKDVPLNPKKKTWVRVYLPNKPEPVNNLPIIVFTHGGGFIVGSAAAPDVDSFLSYAVNQLNVLVVSVEYRLAPEHRLPAAYNDSVEALCWVKETKDEWVRNFGDVTKCVLMGESAGGNLAYTLGLRASHLACELEPLVIKGMVLIQPFFGQTSRTESELNALGALPIEVTDLMWNFSLPFGANRDHLYSNPIVGGSGQWAKIKKLGWRVAFAACDGDGLYDKQVEVFKLMKKSGVKTITSFDEAGYHGSYIHEPLEAKKILKLVQSVLHSHMSY